VGKTEVAKTLAEFMFDDESALIRIDMSEFMEKHSVARLVGAPPGYVGYEEGGLLTNKVKRKPYSVVLFDEVEKGHPDVYNLFLQLFDDGRLTDSQGKTINFANTIILMTSNLGSDSIEPAETEEEIQKMNEGIMQSVHSFFRPEFLNRLDDIIIFRHLTLETMAPIVSIQLKRLQNLMMDREITLNLTDEAIALLAEKGFNPLYGARPLKRVIQTKLQDILAEKIIEGKIKEKQTVTFTAADEELVIQEPESTDTPLESGHDEASDAESESTTVDTSPESGQDEAPDAESESTA
jgi:ATP-dependent Clp protease ATP-binding subunit ClpB